MTISPSKRDLRPARFQVAADAHPLPPDLSVKARMPAPISQPAVAEGVSAPSPLGALLIPAGEPLPPARRLIVLVPNRDLAEADLAGRIWSLASPRGLEVVYLGTARQADEEPRVRRRLATLAAITRDDWAHVQTWVQLDENWIAAVRYVWRPGDLIVCHAEQTLPVWGVGRKALGPALASALKAPVYIVSGFLSEMPARQTHGLARLAYISLPIALVAAFFELQVWIDRLTRSGVHVALFSLSVIVEFGLIWAWDRYLMN